MLQEQEPLLKQEILLIIYFIAILLFLVVFAIVFVIAFQRRKNKLLMEHMETKQKFEKELTNSQLEIQEQTFKNIAWELHDNVGQLLSVVNIQLNMLLSSTPDEYHNQIKETKGVVSETVQEIRSLSKILNHDVVLKNGLVQSLKIELERFNRLKYLEASFQIDGEVVPLKSENEILIFRILQEFLSNVMKHAKASKLVVNLDYKEEALIINAKDDGVGFDTLQKTESSGMQTMKGRAELLKADFSLTSKIGEGTNLYLKYPYKYDS